MTSHLFFQNYNHFGAAAKFDMFRYPELIVIEKLTTNQKWIFPVLRWIRANDSIMIEQYDVSLPQFSHHADQRAKELVTKRKSYPLKEKILRGPPQVAE